MGRENILTEEDPKARKREIGHSIQTIQIPNVQSILYNEITNIISNTNLRTANTFLMAVYAYEHGE